MELSLEIQSIKVDLDRLKRAEARVAEIATATPSQALELESFFIRALAGIAEEIADINLAFKRSEVETERVRSLIMLDLNETGEKKGSNADVRKALVYTNPDFLAAIDRQNQLEAMLSYLREKKAVLEKGFFGSRDVIEANKGFNIRSNINA